MTVWLSKKLVLGLHDEQLAEHGGAAGLRDEGLQESALARPLKRAGYGDTDIAELAALYAVAVARNHPFIDGNKRTAWACLVLFLALNGMEFEPPGVEATMTMLQMASGDMDEAEFTDWVRAHVRTRG